jgi:hypothetical protein
VLKHIEDNGDLAVLANDAGSILLVCETCKRQWLVESVPAARDVAVGVNAQSVIEALRAHPEALEGTSVTLDDLA